MHRVRCCISRRRRITSYNVCYTKLLRVHGPEDQVLETLRHRRSIRRFSTQSVEAEKIDALLEAALRAPSSRELRPWEFVVVTEPATLQKLAEAKQHGAGFLAGAPLAIVVAADPA